MRRRLASRIRRIRCGPAARDLLDMEEGRSGGEPAIGRSRPVDERMSVEMEIRVATAADLPAVLALLKQLDVGKDRDLPLDEAQEIFASLHRYPRYSLYVALAQAQIVGTFALILIDSIAHGGAPHGLVEDVVVDPRWRRHGIGKQMMSFAMQRCREAGCYKMALSSHLSREKTHQFYESLGFDKHGFSFLVQ